MKNSRNLIFGIIALTLAALMFIFALNRKGRQFYTETRDTIAQLDVKLLYGIDSRLYTITEGVVENGQTMGQIFSSLGVSAGKIDTIARKAEEVFSLRKVRAGHNYTAFLTPDSLAKPAYFVYENTATDYMVIDLSGDSVNIHMAQKEVTVKRVTKSASISSSLSQSMTDNGMSQKLAWELSEIYAWSIDFFGLQKEDSFTIIYDEKYVDTTYIGEGTIWGAWFDHGGKRYYAIPFFQDGKIGYWDENGKSLRKNFLKAPLKFSRISSKFSNSRLHPVLRIRRPHHGVDYAAPSGTPVMAVGDGVVIFKGYSGGGGNTIKIKHNSGQLMSGYLHLKGYAQGLKVGSRVSQGQLIGYVGSTGLSTGPHLDFRIWRGGTPIDPLQIPSEPAEPVKDANMTAFNDIKSRVVAELQGTLADSLKVRSLEPPTRDTIATIPTK